jgi:hypothetical protein
MPAQDDLSRRVSSALGMLADRCDDDRIREGVVAAVKRVLRKSDEVAVADITADTLRYLGEHWDTSADANALHRTVLVFLRALQGRQLRLVVGRRGGRTRLRLGPDALSALRAELERIVTEDDREEAAELRENVTALDTYRPEPQAPTPVQDPAGPLVRYLFPVRTGVVGELLLPGNLRRSEAARLVKFIEALATESD